MGKVLDDGAHTRDGFLQGLNYCKQAQTEHMQRQHTERPPVPDGLTIMG